MLQLVLVVQIFVSVVITSKSNAHEDTERNTRDLSAQTQPHTFLDEYTAQDYCESHANFFCVKTKEFICIRAGMCMTESEPEVNSTTEPIAVAGLCPYFPHDSSLCSRSLFGFYQIPHSMSVYELTNYTCNYYNRQGQMCSQCQPGYGPAVYAFSLMCAKCNDNSIGWLFYFTLTLLPITVFYFVIIMLNVQVTSPPLTGFVFMCQTYNFIERLYVDLDIKVVVASRMSTGSSENILRFLVQSVRVFCGFWNLDFFRSIIPPFCISSQLSNMQALFLEYVYVFFPLCLIIFTAICIKLHDKNFKPLVLAWKPFHGVFVRFQNTWDPTASIINSFSTFTLLYTSKLLFVSSYSMYPTKYYHLKPSSYYKITDYHEYFDPTNKVNSRHYWQFVSCSIIILSAFFVCPTLLLCLYPLKVFRRFLQHYLPSKWQLLLYTFIDTFQGHYKDGTDGTRDYRFFSAIHLILLGLIVTFRMSLHINLYATLPALVVCIVGSLLFALLRPCKKKPANIIQSLLMALTALALLALLPSLSSQRGMYASLLMTLMCILIPHVVFGGYVVYRVVQRASMRFGFSISILKRLRKDETMDNFAVYTDMIRHQHSNLQGLIPTESSALLS